MRTPRVVVSGGLRFPASAFPIWRPFQVVFAPPTDAGSTPQPPALIPEDLAGLDPKALAKLEGDLLKKGEKLKAAPASAETVAELREVVDALGRVRAEVTGRAEEAAKHEAEKQELLSALTPLEAPAGEETPEEDEEKPAEPAPPADEAKPDAPDPTAVAAAATPQPVKVRPRAPSIADIPPSAIKPESRPRLEPERPAVTITAAGDVPGFSAGMPIEEKDIGKAFAEKAWALQKDGKGSANVVSMRIAYPEDRQLSPRDTAVAVMERVETVTASGARTRGLSAKGPNAVVAAGGLCAPVAVDYSLMTLGTPRRPVRDALVRFGAERGGIRFIAPPHLADVASGVSLWTHQTDAAWHAGLATKPFVTVACGTETVVQVDAIVLAMVVGNFNRMTFPEQFDAWWQLGQVQFGRYADSVLLTSIAALSTATTAAQDLGAARDILVHLATAAAGYRSRNRLEPDEILQVLLPAWTREVMRADFTRQHPGDEAVQLADSEIDGYLAASSLEPTFYLDTPTTGTNQLFTTQGVGPLEGFPTKLQAFMFAPGTFLHLDGGELNLGTEIRDWTLDQQNQVAALVETLEGVAMHGVEALQITMTACPSGWTAAAQSTAACGGS